MVKYIYLIHSLEDSNYKIGVSIRPKKRLKQLQTGNSSELKLVETYKSEFADQIERTLHRRYTHLKKEGEWFNLGISNEVTFVSECEKIEKNLIYLRNSENILV